MEFSIYLDAGSRRKVTRYFHSAWWLRVVSESPVRRAGKEEFASAKSTRASFASPHLVTSGARLWPVLGRFDENESRACSVLGGTALHFIRPFLPIYSWGN